MCVFLQTHTNPLPFFYKSTMIIEMHVFSFTWVIMLHVSVRKSSPAMLRDYSK